MEPQMIPAGFMAKKVCDTPVWLKAGAVSDIYSVSNCVSEAFCDYVKQWKHNGFWLFDSPAVIREVAAAESIDLSTHRFFYYEVYEEQYDERRKTWEPFEPEKSFETRVVVPEERQLEGYDVVTFYAQTSPECSPLSCNHMAESIPVNLHCLFASIGEAKSHLDGGAFDQCEPGPYRIFAVFSCAAA